MNPDEAKLSLGETPQCEFGSLAENRCIDRSSYRTQFDSYFCEKHRPAWDAKAERLVPLPDVPNRVGRTPSAAGMDPTWTMPGRRLGTAVSFLAVWTDGVRFFSTVILVMLALWCAMQAIEVMLQERRLRRMREETEAKHRRAQENHEQSPRAKILR
jgi:hypothetical protein